MVSVPGICFHERNFSKLALCEQIFHLMFRNSNHNSSIHIMRRNAVHIL